MDRKAETKKTELAHSLPVSTPRPRATGSCPITVPSLPRSANVICGSVSSIRTEGDRSDTQLSDSFLTLPDSVSTAGDDVSQSLRTPVSILSHSPMQQPRQEHPQVEMKKSEASMISSLAGSKSSVGSPKVVRVSEPPSSKSRSFGQAKVKAQEERKKKDRSDTEKSAFTLIFGSFNRQMSLKSVSSASSSRHCINIVTEAQSIVPSLTSAFSIEELPWPAQRWGKDHSHIHTNLTLNTHMAISHDDHLENTEGDEIFERAEYLDTIQSTDSAGSLLKRSLSVPPQYEYRPSRNKPTAREIFQDFLPSEKQQVSRKMDDLIEQPEYENTVQSTSSQAGLLARTALSIIKGNYGTKAGSIDEEDEEFIDPRRYIKNLFVLSIGFLLIFVSYMSLRNLQSSLNNEEGLGLYSLSSVYASLFVGCIFSTTIVQRLRPKLAMLLSGLGFLIYCIANFFPMFYTLIPASCIAGLSLAIIWTSHATYLTNIAARYAEKKGKSLTNTIGKFNGIFYLFFQTSQIWGGIISSTILPSPSPDEELDINATLYVTNSSLSAGNLYSFDTNLSNLTTELMPNTSHCGSSYCHSSDMKKSSRDVDKSVIYTLMGIYTTSCILGVLLLFLLLDPLEGTMKKPTANIVHQLTAVFRHFADHRVLLLLGLMFYSLLQNSFMFGEFTQAFVTCPVGVYMVGYAMLCMSAASAFASYVNSKLLKYTGAMGLFVSAAVIQFSLLIVMLLWTPSPGDMPVFFTIAGLWGIADGIFITQTISLFGVLFTKQKEPAFAGLKMCQAFAAFVLFMTSRYLCMRAKIIAVGIILLIAITGYIVLDVRMRLDSKQRKAPKSRENVEAVEV